MDIDCCDDNPPTVPDAVPTTGSSKSPYLSMKDNFKIGHIGHTVRSVASQFHIVGMSKGFQVYPKSISKAMQYNYISEQVSVGTYVKPESRNVGSQFSRPIPITSQSNFTNLKTVNNLLTTGTFGTSVTELEKSNQIENFSSLVEAIALQSLSTANMAWKSALYRTKWEMVKSAHQMCFDSKYFEF